MFEAGFLQFLTSGHSDAQSARMSKITNDGLTRVWHRMLL